MIGVQMRQISKLDLLIGWATTDMCLIPCISCRWCSDQSAKPLLFSSIFCGLLRIHNFDFFSRRCVALYLCSLMRTSRGMPVSPVYHLPHSHGILYTHWFVCWESLTSPVFINIPRTVCLGLKMFPTLKRFPMRRKFSEIPYHKGLRPYRDMFCLKKDGCFFLAS
jgi:hypothetical protein